MTKIVCGPAHRHILLAAFYLQLIACGSQQPVLESVPESASAPKLEPIPETKKVSHITSFESVYGDGHTFGPSYSHALHYERDSGNYIITMSAYGQESNTTHGTLSKPKQIEVESALDSLDLANVEKIYLTDGTFPASAGDGLSMTIVLHEGEQSTKIRVDTNEPELLPAGLYLIFRTSLSRGSWYDE